MSKTQIYQTMVGAVEALTPRVKAFHLELDRPLEFVAGQFVYALIERDGHVIRKPYSIASPPFQPDRIELAVTLVPGGYVSTWFHGIQGGEKLTVDGAAGRFVVKNPGSAELVFIATGTGVAPIRSILLDLFRKGFERKVWLVFGVRHEDEILYLEEWRQLETRYANFRFIPTISRPQSPDWKGEVGYVQTKLATYIADTREKEVFVCGVVPMVKGVTETLVALGYQPKQIKVEKYT
jgi:ferredoxin-NADP reductase